MIVFSIRCYYIRLVRIQIYSIPRLETKLLNKCWTLKEEKANQDCIGWRADDVTILVNSPADDITNKQN